VKKEAKPDLGNTRINGASEGLARGSKLTGRISRAVSIGEEAIRLNGAAFDSHTRKNAAGDMYFCPDCRAWMSDATVGVHDRRNPTHSSQVPDASGNLKGAHWAKEEHANAGDSAKAIIVQSGGGATGWIIADSEGRRLYGPYPSYSAAEADFKRRNLEMANAGDDGFLRQSGMGLAPAPEPGDELEEPQPIMANARAAVRVKRGAAKYGSRENEIPTLPDREMRPWWESLSLAERKKWIKKIDGPDWWAEQDYLGLPSAAVMDLARKLGIR